MLFKIQYFLILKALLIFASKDDDLKVCVPKLGCLQGTHMPGFETDKFEAFMGIPYAKPPLDKLRLKNPEPVDAWPGTMLVTTPKPDCVQKNYFAPTWPISGDEDCLYLNLYRPIKRNSTKLPVLVYIHGGGFFVGSPNPGIVGPEYFMDAGEVVLVTMAYRLGPFGFLSTGDENMSGNFGLKDQNMALKWVNQYISAFDGSPELVTIFGHSAGGSSVHFHMLSPASKGLFQRAIMLSGSALAPFVETLRNPWGQAVTMAEVAGIANASGLTTNELATALRSVDAAKLLNAGDSLKFWHLTPLTNFRPTIEDEQWPNAFLTEYPKVTSEMGNYTYVPSLMVIVPTKGEGAVLTLSILEFGNLKKEFNENFDEFLIKMLELPEGTSEEFQKNILDSIVAEYLGGVHELKNETHDGFMELFGDLNFYYPFYKSGNSYLHYSDLQRNPLYILKFNYRGRHSHSFLFTGGADGEKDYGVIHGDDAFYLFRMPFLFSEDFEKDSTDAQMMRNYIGLFVEFAKNGKSKHFDRMDNCTETSFQGGGDDGICNYLEMKNFGEGLLEIVDNKFNVKRMRLWNKIFG